MTATQKPNTSVLAVPVAIPSTGYHKARPPSGCGTVYALANGADADLYLRSGGGALIYACWLSMTNFRFGEPTSFVGLHNYRTMMGDPEFRNGLQITLILYVLSLALQLLIGTYLGMLLNRLRFGLRLFQTLLMSPFLTRERSATRKYRHVAWTVPPPRHPARRRHPATMWVIERDAGRLRW